MSGPDRPDRPGEEELEERLDPETRAAFERLDEALGSLERIEPSPHFEARLRARLVRETEEAHGWRARLGRWIALEWLIPAAALVAIVLVLSPDGGSMRERDWRLVNEGELFEIVMSEDPELLAMLDELETGGAAQGAR